MEGMRCQGGGWRVGGARGRVEGRREWAISVCSDHLPTRSVYMYCRIKNHWVIHYSIFNH